MKKLLLAETAVLVVLVLLAVVIRMEISHQDPEDTQPQLSGTTVATDPKPPEDEQVLGTTMTQPETVLPEITWMTFPEDRQLLAQQYFVYDCDTQSFCVLSGTEEERIYPASITKLFTAYVALQYLEPDQKITAKDALELVVPGSSVAKIEWGDVLTVEQLVEAMLLPSGNDAAYILAVEVGRILDNRPGEHASIAAESFVAHMNEQAAVLGMSGTHFVNPDGIHKSEHYSTPKDLVTMAQLALENPTIMKYASTSLELMQLGDRESVEWKNTNALIDPTTQYYCPYAVGLKTGQTPYAGSCLLSAFICEEKTLIIGVFGCPETEDRFPDTLQLFNETMGFTEQN